MSPSIVECGWWLATLYATLRSHLGQSLFINVRLLNKGSHILLDSFFILCFLLVTNSEEWRIRCKCSLRWDRCAKFWIGQMHGLIPMIVWRWNWECLILWYAWFIKFLFCFNFVSCLAHSCSLLRIFCNRFAKSWIGACYFQCLKCSISEASRNKTISFCICKIVVILRTWHCLSHWVCSWCSCTESVIWFVVAYSPNQLFLPMSIYFSLH